MLLLTIARAHLKRNLVQEFLIMSSVVLIPITISSVPISKMELITITLLFSFHTQFAFV